MDFKKYKGRPSLKIEGVDYGEKHTYFITFNTKDRKPVFSDHSIASALLSIIIHSRLELGFCVYGYCIMPDHVHLMAQPLADIAPEKIVRAIKGPMTPVFRKYNYPERLWQRGFTAIPLETEKAFHKVLEYIVLNPVRAGLAEDEFGYPFSGVLDYYL